MPTDTEALNTDTSVATGKHTTMTADTSTTSMKPVTSDDEKSIEPEKLHLEEDVDADVPDFTPPLRINATRVPERLSGSLTTLNIPAQLTDQKMRRRKSDSAAVSLRSGSRSPATHNYDGGSSISSLEDAGIDTDFLTDKMGFLELDLLEQQQSAHSLNKSCSNLPMVAERLSEETLDDVHAFCDVKVDGNYSRGNSITTGEDVSSNVLEPLDEVEEDEDENDCGEVKITNMEEILEGVEEETTEPAATPTSS